MMKVFMVIAAALIIALGLFATAYAQDDDGGGGGDAGDVGGDVGGDAGEAIEVDSYSDASDTAGTYSETEESVESYEEYTVHGSSTPGAVHTGTVSTATYVYDRYPSAYEAAVVGAAAGSVIGSTAGSAVKSVTKGPVTKPGPDKAGKTVSKPADAKDDKAVKPNDRIKKAVTGK